MDRQDFRLGRLVPKPAKFRHNRTVEDVSWLYQIDDKLGIVYRRAKHWDSREPSGYYTFRSVTTVERIKDNLFGTTLKRGIVIPSLVGILLCGMFLIAYPLLPGINFRLQQEFGSFGDIGAYATTDPNHNRVIIPKIGVDTTILEGPSLSILNKKEGVWHQRGRIAGDNFVISGHRFKYLPPNTSTFYNLGEVVAGDLVYIDWYGKRLSYTVVETKRIHQDQNEILEPSKDSKLTIYTCYDKKQTERIVVIATPSP